MKENLKKIISLLLCCAILFSIVSCNRKKPGNDGPSNSGGGGENSGGTGNVGEEGADLSDYIVNESNIPLMLHYDEQTPFINDDGYSAFGDPDGINYSWEHWSLPIGNGYFGVNVFGRTETERVQIADKTLENAWQAEIPEESWPQTGGLNNFAETYLDINHTYSKVSDYNRYLDLSTAISGVSYTYEGVAYEREYFTSYPDKALVIRLDADTDGKISFVLRPVVPYEQEYMTNPKDEFGKYGSVVSSVSDGIGHIELSGKMTYYDIDFVAYYDVYTDGGSVSATNCINSYGELDGTITVSGANSAYIVVTLGSDYELNSTTFMTGQHEQNKPTVNTTLEDAKKKVNGYLEAINAGINGKTYEDAYAYLLGRHLSDYQNLFGRVNVDLDCDESDFDMTTDDLLAKYQSGAGSTYLETLLLQYGRYLLIASSRKGTLPAHLQGAWNVYNSPAWSSGYWNNINIQMNYWHAFSTNIAETFESYVDYMDIVIPAARTYANDIIWTYNNGVYNDDGGNGWTIGTASNAYFIMGDRNCGNAGFTTQLYWDYYQYTKDPEILQKVYDVMLDAAKFITKCVKEYDGKYLVEYSDSPEMHVDGVWYYTQGTTYAQTLAYLNNYSVLELAKELGIDITDSNVLSASDKKILKTIIDQLDKYDPINVGLSGQIKEYRQEDYYGSLGHETTHRHISHLVGLFPGNLINANTEAWLDAALVSVNGRIDGLQEWHQSYTVGWSWAHKAAMYARLAMGDMAQEMILGGAKGATNENLLMRCFQVFQIEASCGTSAALAEMLLQSQNDYVAPLAAIPSNWQNGSYSGLVARGNFEVSAAWENGIATSFNITSNKGEKLSVMYPSVTEAFVYTLDGTPVQYEVTGQDLISFDTVEGETYVIYGFKEVETPDKVSALNYDVVSYGTYNFTWEKVNGAASYNLYVAYENDAKYTLMGTVDANVNSFNYSVPSGKENVRKTFCITAVNEEGRESGRTLTYYNPEVTEVNDNIFSGKQFVPTPDAANMQYNDGLGYQCLTDGIHYKEGAGRFSTKYNGFVDATISLGAIYQLTNIRFYIFQKDLSECGSSIHVEICYNGTWKTVKEITNAEYSQYLKNDDHGEYLDTAGSGQYLQIDLDNVLAEKIRIYIPSPAGSGYITFYEIEASGSYVGESTVSDNVFEGKDFVPTSDAANQVWDSSFGYSNLTDGARSGESSGRFSTKSDATFDATIDLGATYSLSTLKMYIYDTDWANSSSQLANKYLYFGKDLLIQVYANGEWKDAVSCASNEAIVEYLVETEGSNNDYLEFNLNGIQAEKVRIYISSAVSGTSITYQEFQCSGSCVKEGDVDSNVFAGKDFVPTSDAANQVWDSSFGYSNLTDGVRSGESSGRFSTKSDATFDATIDLGAAYSLSTLKMYIYDTDWANDSSQLAKKYLYFGKDMLIQVYANGEWKDAVNCASNEAICEYLVETNGSNNDYLGFNLSGIEAEKIRIYISGTVSGTSITYQEFECSGYAN